MCIKWRVERLAAACLEASGGQFLTPFKLHIDMCIVYVCQSLQTYTQLRHFVVTLYCKMDLRELGCERVNRIHLMF